MNDCKMRRNNKKHIKTLVLALMLVFTFNINAATLSPWASISSGITVQVQTSFTPSWLTTSGDATYGVSSNRYIRSSWVRIQEGNYNETKTSSNYYRPSTTWVHTSLSKVNNPLKTAYASYGWSYQ